MWTTRCGGSTFARYIDSTGLVFIKGLLQHDYGVRPGDMNWVIGGLDAISAATQAEIDGLLEITAVNSTAQSP